MNRGYSIDRPTEPTDPPASDPPLIADPSSEPTVEPVADLPASEPIIHGNHE